MHRFSVLIPCYNCFKTLADTLTSCLQQNYYDFEVILVDDCSTESIVSIYDDFLPLFTEKHIPLKYHRNNVNSGVSFSRNFAWDIAIGEYICFLDSDDIWHEAKLQIIDHFLKLSNIDCLCHSYTDNEDDFFTENDFVNYQITKLSLTKLLLKNPAQTSCFVIKRAIQYRFDVTMSYSEDYELWLRVSDRHPIHRLYGKPLTLLARPQKTPGGLSANRFKMRLGELIAYLHLAKTNNSIKLLLPALFAYSVLKHVRSEIGLLINKRLATK